MKTDIEIFSVGIDLFNYFDCKEIERNKHECTCFKYPFYFRM